MTKPKIVVKKAAKKKKPVTKIVVHNPEPVVEVIVDDAVIAHDPTFLERAMKWLEEAFK